MDGLPLLSWQNLGPWGLIAIVVVLILLGRLIPYVTWRSWQTTWAERLADAKAENTKLHDVVTKQAELFEVYNSQLKDLLTATRTSERILASLQAREVNNRAVVVEAPEAEGVG